MLPLLIVLVFAGATHLPAQESTRDSETENHVQEPLTLEASGSLIEGYIDWTKNELVVYGDAVAPDEITNPAQRRLLGFRGAKVVAFRNLLEMVGQVQVDTQTRVQNVVLASDSIHVRVQGIIRGARVVAGSQVENDGLYRIALRLPLLGEFANTVLPEVASIDPNSYDLNLPYSPPPEFDPADSLAAEEEPVVFVPHEPYTGLLVDTRGIDLQPSMSPQIVSENERVIYGAATVDRSYSTQFGIAGYDKDIERALKSDRLGGEKSNPFVVKATRTAGLYSGDVVLSDFDATRVLIADGENNFLRECRVTFVLGPEPAIFEEMNTDSTHTDTALISEGDELELYGETEASDQPQ